jgi:hypothetical protein
MKKLIILTVLVTTLMFATKGAKATAYGFGSYAEVRAV